jgi:hypothetical protein
MAGGIWSFFHRSFATSGHGEIHRKSGRTAQADQLRRGIQEISCRPWNRRVGSHYFARLSRSGAVCLGRPIGNVRIGVLKQTLQPLHSKPRTGVLGNFQPSLRDYSLAPDNPGLPSWATLSRPYGTQFGEGSSHGDSKAQFVVGPQRPDQRRALIQSIRATNSGKLADLDLSIVSPSSPHSRIGESRC